MPKISRQVGTTSLIVDIFVQNNSVATGAGLTGLVFGTSGLTAYYHRNTASSSTSITLATMTLGTWATGGFIVADATNMPGVYQVGIPNAALTSGADSVVIYLQGATNMAPVVLEIELTAVNNQSTAFGLSIAKTTNITGFNDIAATAIVSAGAITTSSGAVSSVTTVTNQLTAAAIATGVWQDATGGDFTTASSIGKSLYTSGNAPGAASGLAIVGSNVGTATSVSGAVGSVTGNVGGTVASVVGNVGGNVTGSVGSVAGGLGGNVTGSVGSVLGNVDGNVVGSVASVTGNVGGSVASVTGNLGGNVVGSVASVTGNIAGNLGGNVGGNVAGSIGSVTAPVTVDLTQTLSAARALDSVADTSLTLNDGFMCAVAGAAGKKDASSGTQFIISTPSTGTVLRTYTITTTTIPTTVPDKIA